jgi:hypothetical protein
VNTYDAARPKGRERIPGAKVRERKAAPGSALDDVYASRYHLIAEDETVRVTFGDDDGDQGETPDPNVDTAIADETPPEARKGSRAK